MPRQLSKIICHVCHTKGGFIGRRLDGNAGFQIPTKLDENNLSQAWKYAARVCLRLNNQAMLYPPSEKDDKRMAQAVYGSFIRWFTSHTEEDIRAFELRHSSITETEKKYIEAKKVELSSQVKKTTEYDVRGLDTYDSVSNKLPFTKTRHARLPSDVGRVSKYSVAWLYAAIVCMALSDMTRGFYPQRYEYGKYYAKAIYSFFSILASDSRYRKSGVKWFDRILIDVQEYGYNAAASKSNLSRKYVKDKSKVLIPMKDDMEKYLNAYFLSIVLALKESISENSYLNKGFIERFSKYELQASAGIFLKKFYYYIRHHESASPYHKKDQDIGYNRNNYLSMSVINEPTRCKRRECHIKEHELAYIKVGDERYPLYSQLINSIAKSIVCKEDRGKRGHYYGLAESLLRGMGWPNKFLEDKIREDIREVILQRERKLLLLGRIVPQCTPRILSMVL